MTKLSPSCLGLVAVALAQSACARNAVLEIELSVPPAPPGMGPPIFAFTQFGDDTTDWGADWGIYPDFDGVALGSAARVVRFSLLSEDETKEVRMRVRYCSTERCEEIRGTPPQVRFQFHEAFYIGERTRYRTATHTAHMEELGAVPPPPARDDEIPLIDVTKCDIEGCVRASGPVTSFCRMSQTHFCEDL